MTVKAQPQPWESNLLVLAQDAWNSVVHAFNAQVDAAQLRRAYQHCARLTKQHSKSFYLASALMPDAKRRATRALYAFCRVGDDLIDRSAGDPQAAIQQWSDIALAVDPHSDDPVVLAWSHARSLYRIPHRYAEQLINGVARDLWQTRYQTFDELAEYSYGVASTVGLMSMHIVGFSGLEAIPYAVKLGVALQITNILRDVGEDCRSGRVYLPQEELADFGITEDQIAAGRVDDRWREFMRFQIARNRRLYKEAWPGVAMLNRDGRFAVAAAATLYRGILDDLEAHDYNNFTRRSYVNQRGKVARLAQAWWSVR
ncbi:MAG TPA: squalene/phytoene synthase family protein [Anaerolineae bacterium]|nr:squalene/phytoene synthase family protein [Anaerolineae bacterium]